MTLEPLPVHTDAFWYLKRFVFGAKVDPNTRTTVVERAQIDQPCNCLYVEPVAEAWLLFSHHPNSRWTADLYYSSCLDVPYA